MVFSHRIVCRIVLYSQKPLAQLTSIYYRNGLCKIAEEVCRFPLLEKVLCYTPVSKISNTTTNLPSGVSTGVATIMLLSTHVIRINLLFLVLHCQSCFLLCLWLKLMSLSHKQGLSWTGAGISHVISRDVHGVSLQILTGVSTQWRIAPCCSDLDYKLTLRAVQSKTGDQCTMCRKGSIIIGQRCAGGTGKRERQTRRSS